MQMPALMCSRPGNNKMPTQVGDLLPESREAVEVWDANDWILSRIYERVSMVPPQRRIEAGVVVITGAKPSESVPRPHES